MEALKAIFGGFVWICCTIVVWKIYPFFLSGHGRYRTSLASFLLDRFVVTIIGGFVLTAILGSLIFGYGKAPQPESSAKILEKTPEAISSNKSNVSIESGKSNSVSSESVSQSVPNTAQIQSTVASNIPTSQPQLESPSPSTSSTASSMPAGVTVVDPNSPKPVVVKVNAETERAMADASPVRVAAETAPAGQAPPPTIRMPQDACADRPNFISRNICLDRECQQPEKYELQFCRDLRAQRNTIPGSSGVSP